MIQVKPRFQSFEEYLSDDDGIDENGQIANRLAIATDRSANQVIRKIIFALNNGTKLGYFIDRDRSMAK